MLQQTRSTMSTSKKEFNQMEGHDVDYENAYPAGSYQDFNMGYLEKGRRPKFTAQELEALVVGVETHKDVILPAGGAIAYQGSLSSNIIRQNSWKDILATVNSVSEVKRALPEVVKRWRYLKSRTRVKARRLTKWDKPLNDLQKRILDTVGDMEGSPNGDKDHDDEEGWDEVYEIDVGDVDEDNDMEDGDQPLVVKGRSEERPTTTEANRPHIMTSDPTSHMVNSASGVSQRTTYPSHVTPSRVNVTNSAPSLRNHQRISYERAPPIYEDEIESGEQDFHRTVYQTNRSDRYPDKNNVNITVQSCSCSKNNNTNKPPNIDQERLEIEKQRLDVEKQRLEIEKQRLELERERLQIKKTKREGTSVMNTECKD